MKSQKDLIKIINNYKMINSDIEILPNGNKYIWAEFSIMKEHEDRMTINQLAKEMREGFKHLDAKIDNLKQYVDNRFDKIEQRLDEHSDILKRNNLK